LWEGPDESTNESKIRHRSQPQQAFTEKQGRYLAFIYTYSHMFRRPPAETDMQRHFQVSPPSVHQMIVTLERNGLIQRQPGVARSIQVLVAPKDLPILDWLKINQS
jgi:DNA-binding MarR family transcriptional regulator